MIYVWIGFWVMIALIVLNEWRLAQKRKKTDNLQKFLNNLKSRDRGGGGQA
jgi:hypothetical protein